MKNIFFALALVASIASAPAQFNTPTTGINATMIKLFGDTKAFTAKAEVRMVDKDQKEISAIPLVVALRDGKLRAEMDLSEIKGGAIPPEAAAMMKQAGMDKMISVVRSDKKVTLISYPGLKSYAEVPFTASETADEKAELTDAGKDTIDGHPCLKKKLTTTDSKGRPQEAFVWQATDMKNFPVQIEMAQRSNKLIVKLQPPKLETPEAALFDAPAGYTKYNGVQELMQAAMLKMFGGGAK